MSNNLKITDSRSPLALLDILRAKLEAQTESPKTVKDVMDCLHMSQYTYTYLMVRPSEAFKNVFVRKLKTKISNMTHGYYVKRPKVTGAYDLVKTLSPLNFMDTNDGRLRFENMKYILSTYSSSLLIKRLIEGGVDEYMTKFGISTFNDENTIQEYFIKAINVINQPVYEYTSTDTLIAVIMAYILGLNSTFLEGVDDIVYMFRGTTGGTFAKEHTRFKLLYLYDLGVIPMCDELIFCLVSPDEKPYNMVNLCNRHGVNSKAVMGMYQPLFVSDPESLYATGDFKRMLKHHHLFLA